MTHENPNRFEEMCEAIIQRNKNSENETLDSTNPEVLAMFYARYVQAVTDMEYMARINLKPSVNNMKEFIERSDFVDQAKEKMMKCLTILLADTKIDKEVVKMLSEAYILDVRLRTRKLPG